MCLDVCSKVCSDMHLSIGFCDLLETNGLACTAGDDDSETITFLVAPDPAHV